MRRRVRSMLFAILGGIALTGCEGADVTAGEGPSWFRATVTGSVEATYEGKGFFDVWKNDREGGVTQFAVLSRSDDDSHYFALYDFDGGRPARGTYAIGLDGPFRAFYVTRDAATGRYFVAQSGRVEITHSSRDRVEGTFQLQGFQYCALPRVGGGPTAGPCSTPTAVIQGAPTVSVTGSFVSHQTRGQAVPL